MRLALIVVLLSVPALAQKKKPVPKKPVAPAVGAAAVQPAAPAKKRTPSMTASGGGENYAAKARSQALYETRKSVDKLLKDYDAAAKAEADDHAAEMLKYDLLINHVETIKARTSPRGKRQTNRLGNAVRP